MSGYDRREFIGLSARMAVALGVASAVPAVLLDPVKAGALAAVPGLSDPDSQPKFSALAPNALDPGFKYAPTRGGRFFQVGVFSTSQETGLVQGGAAVSTDVFAYGDSASTASWPGKTFEVPVGTTVNVEWQNNLPAGGPDALPPIYANAAAGGIRNVVDTSLHWCYSLPGYEQYSIAQNGVPIVVHVHGGHNLPLRDGNPEYFFSPGYGVTGPRWSGPVFQYPNDQPAGTNWYHDHALGITRLNVYAGMAGFFILRDDQDTGEADNPLGLPAEQYELAYAIQDRMFCEDGRLFYPAFPNDPAYGDFITGEGAQLPPDLFPSGGPTALAEFFGDHMLVNGKIWPKADVEPRTYRIRLLNGCDSRFLILRLREADSPTSETPTGDPIGFTVIGSDQGRLTNPVELTELVMGPGERYDLIVDFAGLDGKRIILDNIGGDEPFGGGPGPQLFEATNLVMAFDVGNAVTTTPVLLGDVGVGPQIPAPTRTRKVALFEGKDNFGRLQPLLGTAEPATTATGRPINWPNKEPYVSAGLVGQVEGSIAWHSPTTENPALNSTEEWEIWNLTGDSHPVHLHLVNFEILERQSIRFDTAAEDGVIADPAVTTPNNDGVYLQPQPVVQHDGAIGSGFVLRFPTDPASYFSGPATPAPPVEKAPKDTVIANPGEVTRIKATFDKAGRYVWHCHILSHEDHEMMRVLEVGAISGRPGGRP